MITVKDWLEDLVSVTDEEWLAIQAITETNALKANEVIVQQGRPGDKIGLLVQGAVRTFFTDTNGHEKVVNFSFEGEPLILMDSFFNQMPSAVSSVTLEPSVVIWTDLARYSAFVAQYPRYNAVLISALSRWFAEGKSRMAYLHQPSAAGRYAAMCALHPKINERVPLKYIASYLSITQATLSRIRAKR